MERYKLCRDVVRRFSRKYSLNRAYLWDLLNDEFNIIKGFGCVMTTSQIDIFEETILLNQKEDEK